jgi:WD40 repeat protein
MRFKLPRPRYGLRTLLVLVLVSSVAAWYFTNEGRWRAYRNQQARKLIDPYELSIAGDGNPRNVPPELVAILGDSRLRHWSWVSDVEILPGERVASLGKDGLLRVWDLKTLRQEASYECTTFVLAPDRKHAFLALNDGTVEQWDLDAGRKQTTIAKPKSEGWVTLACSGDGNRLVIQNKFRGGAREASVIDVNSQETLWHSSVAESNNDELALDQEGKRLAWTKGSQIEVVDVATGDVLNTLGPILNESGNRCGINQIEFAMDDSKLFVASALSSLLSFDLASGNQEMVVDHEGGSLHSFALSKSGRELAVLQGWLHVHYLSEGKWGRGTPRAFGTGHVHDVSRDGLLIAAAHHDHTISLWHRSNSHHPWRLPNGGLKADVTAIAFHPRGEWLITGSRTGELSLWDMHSWAMRRTWKGHVRQVKHIDVSATGDHFVTSGEDGEVVVWNSADQSEVASLHDFQMGFPVALSPDGKRLATYARGPSYSGIWDLPEGEELPRTAVPCGPLERVVFSPAGDRLVARNKAQSIVFVDPSTLQVLWQIPTTPTTQTPLRWFRDGNRVLLSDGADTLSIYDVRTKKVVQSLSIAGVGTHSFALDRSGEWIALSGISNPVQLWHLPTAKLVKSWQIGPPRGIVSQVEFSPDGHYLATVNGNGTAYILSLDGVLKP